MLCCSILLWLTKVYTQTGYKIMKTNKHNTMKTTIITLLSLFLLNGCDKDDNPIGYNPQLPAITQTGANTVGCKINGVIMVPRNSIDSNFPYRNFFPVRYLSALNFEYERIRAGDDHRNTRRGGISIYFQNNPVTGNPTPAGNHPIYNGILGSGLNDNYKDYMTFSKYNEIKKQYDLYFSIEGTGSVILTKSDNNIISGTFSCKAKNENNPNDVIEVTEGRFDFNKATINTTNFF